MVGKSPPDFGCFTGTADASLRRKGVRPPRRCIPPCLPEMDWGNTGPLSASTPSGHGRRSAPAPRTQSGADRRVTRLSRRVSFFQTLQGSLWLAAFCLPDTTPGTFREDSPPVSQVDTAIVGKQDGSACVGDQILSFDISRVVPRQSILARLRFHGQPPGNPHRQALAIHKTPAPKCIASGGHRPARQNPPAMTQHIRLQREAGSKDSAAD